MVSQNHEIPIATMSFPTRMVVGPGALARLPDEVRGLKGRRVFIVADPGVEAAGIVGQVRGVLERGDVPHATYLGVSKNPVEKDVLDGVAEYRRSNSDVIVGVGGGAALDVAKAIRLKATHELPLEAYDDLKDGSNLIGPSVPPMVAIPTTAGTGSEVGRSTVIVLGAVQHKVVIFSPHLLPNVALLDAELTFGLPPHVTAATGMDALTHCLEAYVAKGTHPFADMFALGGLARVGAQLVAAVRDGRDVRARHEMLLAASMGAISFQKGLGACHSLAHPLSSVADLHHGLANSIMLPHVIEYNLDAAYQAYAVAGEALGVKAAGSVEARADACRERIIEIIRDIGLPTRLGDLGVNSETVDRMLPQAMADGCHASNPKVLTEEAARALYEAAL